MVNRDDYKATLEKAVVELTEVQDRRAELDTERDQLDARIAELKQGIMALAPLCGVTAQIKYADLIPEYALLPPGLKEAVLSVLALVPADNYITPVAIRDSLPTTGYEIKSKNILPSIHNVLKRLEKASPPEVESTDLDGKTGYRLVKKQGGTRMPPMDAGGSPPKMFSQADAANSEMNRLIREALTGNRGDQSNLKKMAQEAADEATKKK